MDEENDQAEEKEKQSVDISHIKFKPLSIKQNIPIDFWKPKEDEASDEPMILEVKDANEGVPERSKCIVCYKSILENDKDTFKCPNCGREAHYLCATIFITEHGICPVCSTKIVLDKISGEYVAIDKLLEP